MANLEQVLGSISDIPTLPAILAKLTQLIADPATTASDISDVLSRDPGLSAKVLRIVNSAYFGFPRRIATITHAIVILGFTQMRNLALSAFVVDNFGSGGESGFDLLASWRHSIGTAFGASQIARRLDARLEEDAFVCGLLHDLGKCVMAQKAPDDMDRVVEAVKKDNLLFIEAERRTLEYDHAMLGAAIIERWNLPEVMVNVIRHHHDPSPVGERDRMLAAMVNVANVMSRSLLMGSSGDARIPRLAPEVWNLLKFDWGTMERAARRTADEYRKLEAFFSKS